MSVNNNFYAITNELFSRATGGGVSATQVVDYDTFIDAGKALSSMLYTDLQNTLIPAIMNKIQKTINDNPSYSGALVDMYTGKLDYGVLEIIINDFYAASASTFDGATIENGETYTDQFKVENIGNESAKYYTESDSYQFNTTVRDTDLKGIFDSPEKFDGFIRSKFISIANSIESRKEVNRLAVLAKIIKACAGTTKNYTDENAPAKFYDLLAIYNTAKSTSLTQANCMLNNDFCSFVASVMRDVALLMEKPSKSFNVTGTRVTFTPPEYRKIVINGIFDKNLRRSLIDAYNKEYGMIDFEYEVVPYWQLETDRLRVTTNATPEQGQPIVTTYSPYVLAVMYDKRACGELVQLEDVTTDRNGGRRYTNYHWQLNSMYFVNADANTVIFTIGSAA